MIDISEMVLWAILIIAIVWLLGLVFDWWSKWTK